MTDPQSQPQLAVFSEEDRTKVETAIKELLDLANGDISIRGGSERAPQVAYGLFMQLVNQAVALMVLRREKEDGAAAPMRRSILELAMHLVWVANDGEEAVDVYNVVLQYQLNKVVDLVEQTDLDAVARDIAAATIAIDLPPAKTDRIATTKMFKRYDVPPWLPAVWPTESGFVHPSLHIVRQYVVDTEDGPELRKRSAHDWSDTTLAACLYCLCLGALAVSRFMVDEPWAEALRDLARRLNLPEQLPAER